MAETGCEFEDPDTVARKTVIVGTCQAVNELLIRDARRDDAHIHASARRQRERVAHFVRDDQIGSDKPGIFLRAFRHADIDVLTDVNIVHRRIGVGLHKSETTAFNGRCICQILLILRDLCPHFFKVRISVLLNGLPAFGDGFPSFLAEFRIILNLSVFLLHHICGRAVEHILFKIFVIPVFPRDRIPHLKEGHSKALHRIAFQADACILPETKGLCLVEVLISQVISARIAHFAVDDRNLAVIAVVEEQVESGCEGIEYAALNAILLRALYEVRIDKAKASHVIVKDADLYAGLDSFCKDVADLMPALRVLNGVILHEDKLLRLCHILFLGLDAFLRIVKIFDLRILIDRVACIAPDVIDDTAKPSVSLPCIFCLLFSVRQHGEEDLVDILISLAHLERVAVETDHHIKRCSEDRNEQDHQHPGHTDRCGLVASVNAEHNHRAEEADCRINPARFLSGKIEQ